MPPGERAGQRAEIEADANRIANRPEAQAAIKAGVAKNVQIDLAKAASRGALTPDQRDTALYIKDGFTPAKPIEGIAGDGSEIIVTGSLVKTSDKALLRAGDTTIVQRTGRAVEPVSSFGGGAVEGTGTGLINNAKDTVGLIGDGVGFTLNKLSGGYVYQGAATRTQGRIDGAVALGEAAVSDPRGTAKKLGESYIAPFVKGADQLRSGDTYGGTVTISEQASDKIVELASGGAKAFAKILAGGVPGVPGILKKLDGPDVKPKFKLNDYKDHHQGFVDADVAAYEARGYPLGASHAPSRHNEGRQGRSANAGLQDARGPWLRR